MMMQGIKKDNSITAVYNNWGVSSKEIFYKDYLSYIYKMTVNGMEITPTYEYNGALNDFTVTMWFSQPLNNISYFFYNIQSVRSVDFSNFISNKLTNIQSSLQGSQNLTTINLKNFYTPSLLIMNSMFAYCRALTSLDLSSFNTSNVTRMDNMFSDCTNINSPILVRSEEDKIRFETLATDTPANITFKVK